MMNTTIDATNQPEFQPWLKEMLSSDVDVLVTFTKADGSERTMRCTKRSSSIPQDKTPKGTGRSSPEGTERVFDLDKQEWRSFKWDSVKRAHVAP
jgi:hypothetical protein